MCLNNNIKIMTNLDINEAIKKVSVKYNYILIDNKIIWYGDINPFTYLNKEATSILRIKDLDYINEIKKLNFDDSIN